jgi:hypothetical protein
MSHAVQSLSSIYEEDYQQWLDETVLLLKNRQVDGLDYEHLIEELEALGREQKNAVDSLVIQVINIFYSISIGKVDENITSDIGEAGQSHTLLKDLQ